MADVSAKIGLDFEGDEALNKINEAGQKMEEVAQLSQKIKPVEMRIESDQALEDLNKRLNSINDLTGQVNLDMLDGQELGLMAEIYDAVNNISSVNSALIEKMDIYIDRLSSVVGKTVDVRDTKQEILETEEELNKRTNELLGIEEESTEQKKEQLSLTEKVLDKISQISSKMANYKVGAKMFEKMSTQADNLSNIVHKEAKLEKDVHQTLLNKLRIYKSISTSVGKIGDKLRSVDLKKGFADQISSAVSSFKSLVPLFALLSLGALVKEIADADAEAKKLYRDFVQLASTQKDINGLISDFSPKRFMATMASMKGATQDFATRWGISIQESQDRLNALVASGASFTEALGDMTQASSRAANIMGRSQQYAMDLGDSISAMAMMSGKSFADMANDVVMWRNTLGVSFDQSHDAFVQLRDDANQTGLQTTKFFEKVMNASTSLIIYGTRIQDVSALFRDLTKDMDLPREKAAELAASLMKGADQFSWEQKVLIGNLGEADKMLEERVSELRTRMAGEKLRGNQEEVKQLERQIKALEGLKAIPDAMERTSRIFEQIDPASQLEMRLRALMKGAEGIFKGINIADSKEMKKVLYENREKLSVIGKEFGFSTDDLLYLEEKLGIMSENVSGLQSLFGKQEQTQKDFIAQFKKQTPESLASAIESKFKGVTPAEMINSFKTVGMHKVVENLQNINDSEKLYVEIADNISDLSMGIDDWGKVLEKDEKDRIREQEKQASKEIARLTTAFQTSMQNTLAKVTHAVYDILQKYLPRFWEALKRFPGVEKALSAIEAFGKVSDLDNSIKKYTNELMAMGKDDPRRGDVLSKLGAATKLRSSMATLEAERAAYKETDKKLGYHPLARMQREENDRNFVDENDKKVKQIIDNILRQNMMSITSNEEIISAYISSQKAARDKAIQDVINSDKKIKSVTDLTMSHWYKIAEDIKPSQESMFNSFKREFDALATASDKFNNKGIYNLNDMTDRMYTLAKAMYQIKPDKINIKGAEAQFMESSVLDKKPSVTTQVDAAAQAPKKPIFTATDYSTFVAGSPEFAMQNYTTRVDGEGEFVTPLVQSQEESELKDLYEKPEGIDEQTVLPDSLKMEPDEANVVTEGGTITEINKQVEALPVEKKEENVTNQDQSVSKVFNNNVNVNVANGDPNVLVKFFRRFLFEEESK